MMSRWRILKKPEIDQESEAEDNGVENLEDEDEDGRDLGSESEDNEVDNSEDVEPTTELAVAWLGSLPKDQKILREGKTYKILLPHTPLLIPVL